MRYFQRAEGKTMNHSSARAEADALNFSSEETSYVVIDTELTGLNPKKDSIISIGAVKMSGGRIKLNETFHSLIRPETVIRRSSILIHEITPSDVEKKPSADVVIRNFLDFCGESVIVGHFLSLDLSFLNKQMKELFNRTVQGPVIDTFRIYSWMKECGDSYSHFGNGDGATDLFSVAQKFEIRVSDAHDALMDAFVTAQLFQRFLAFLPGMGVRTMKELLMIGRP
jgi:DNA polymerase III subunit epsilon